MTDKVQGPFHVSRSSDGVEHWFSARDAASGVTIPAKDRDDAYALVSSLNRACETIARTNTGLVEALRDLETAEYEYRKLHDLHGDGDIRTGRAWDRMRRKGDAARKALSVYGDEM